MSSTTRPLPLLPVLLVLLVLLPLLRPALAVSIQVQQRSTTCPVILPRDLPPSLSRTSSSSTTPRIIGGDISPDSSNLFTLALRSSLTEASTRRLCTAARLSTSWGITAAHCGINTTWTAELPDGSFAAIEEVHTHEGYRDITDRIYDIAVFRLADSAADAGRIVRVNNRDERPASGAFVRVLGFGSVGTEGHSAVSSTDLRQVDIPVVPFDKCKAAYENVAKTGLMDASAQLCAGYMDSGGCDSCVGDSGGPLMQYNSEGKPVLVALVSAGRGCAMPGFPGINLRVNKYVDWMKSKGAIFDVDDAPVQVILNGEYPGKPPSEPLSQSEPSPKPVPPKPSPSQSSAPAPIPEPPSPPPKEEEETPPPNPPDQQEPSTPPREPLSQPIAPTRTPKPTQTPEAPQNVQDPQEEHQDEDAATKSPSPSPIIIEVPASESPGPSGGFPVVQEPSSGPFPTVQDPSPSQSAQPTGAAAAPENTSQADGDSASTSPSSEPEGDDGEEGFTPNNGAINETSPKTSGGNDARTAGIVAGSIAGVIIVGGLITLLFMKMR